MRIAAVATTGLLLLVAGCGSSSNGIDSGNLSRDRCVDIAVAALNSLDLSEIDVTDGVSDSETEHISQLLDEVKKIHPELAEGGQCGDIVSGEGFSDDEQQQIFDRLTPEVREKLGDSTESKFSSVGSEIN